MRAMHDAHIPYREKTVRFISKTWRLILNVI